MGGWLDSGVEVVVASESAIADMQMHLDVAGHVAAGKAAVARSWKTAKMLSIGFDDSSLRSHELNFQTIVLPTNEAMWCAVQEWR